MKKALNHRQPQQPGSSSPRRAMRFGIPPAIKNPCPKSWDDMTGDAKRRFCDHCQLHVHNLPEMTPSERTSLFENDRDACIRYPVDSRGTMLPLSDAGRIARWFLGLKRAAIALTALIVPFALSSCATRDAMGKPKSRNSISGVALGK